MPEENSISDPSKKRARRSSSPSHTAPSSAPLPVHARQRSKKYWFPDGNVVLATQTRIFRVYQGMLSQRAQVFQDMFSIPQPAAQDVASDEILEGAPVVHVTDSSDDMHNFLDAIFQSTAEFVSVFLTPLLNIYISDTVSLLVSTSQRSGYYITHYLEITMLFWGLC